MRAAQTVRAPTSVFDPGPTSAGRRRVLRGPLLRARKRVDRACPPPLAAGSVSACGAGLCDAVHRDGCFWWWACARACSGSRVGAPVASLLGANVFARVAVLRRNFSIAFSLSQTIAATMKIHPIRASVPMIASLARKAGMVVVKNIWWLPWPALAIAACEPVLPVASGRASECRSLRRCD